MGKPCLVIGILLALAVLAPSAVEARGGDGPYKKYPEEYKAVKAVVEGKGDYKKAKESLEKIAEEVVIRSYKRPQGDEIGQVFCLLKALEVLGKEGGKHREMSLLLLDRPEWCGRFVYALSRDDKVDGALKVLDQLRKHDPREFEKKFEFCLAFALVWDDFHGHWWVDKYTKMPPNAMMDLYQYYLDNEKKMFFKPGSLPYELNLYVVGTRLTKEERDWVLKNYNKGSFANPYRIYSSVPWTLDSKNTISPGHEKGLDKPYTLMNIKSIGGCCMDQAYYTENVCRLFGIPATYTHGRGKRGGHAWTGVLLSRPQLHWNFDCGRYDYDNYFKGESADPTHMERSVTDSEVKMTSALVTEAGSFKKLLDSNYCLAAAQWGAKHLPEMADKTLKITRQDVVRKLLYQSFDAAAFNARAWHYVAERAASGKMDSKRAFDWTKKMVEMTVQNFPDFTVDCLAPLLKRIERNEDKLKAVQFVYKALEKNRVDLACEVKIWEADIHMEMGNVAPALYAYIYPLSNFAEDQHVLDRAKEGLSKLSESITDDKKLEDAYWKIVKVGARSKNARTAKGILNMAYGELAKIYRKRGDEKKAAQLEAQIKK